MKPRPGIFCIIALKNIIYGFDHLQNDQMISIRQKLLKRVQDWKNIRTTTNTAVQDELDDKNIPTSKTRSKRIISIESPFPKGEKCFVDTENGGYFCAKRFLKHIFLEVH